MTRDVMVLSHKAEEKGHAHGIDKVRRKDASGICVMLVSVISRSRGGGGWTPTTPAHEGDVLECSGSCLENMHMLKSC